jgi:hypothetical protein
VQHGTDYADSRITDLFENSMNKSQTLDAKDKILVGGSGHSPRIVANVEILNGNLVIALNPMTLV